MQFRPIFKYVCLFFGIGFLFQACQAQETVSLPINKDGNSLLWEIKGKQLKKPSYLFGTFHLMCKEDIHFSANLGTALKNSQELYLEMDMDDPANVFGAIFMMNMRNDTTLKDLYSEAEYKKVMDFFGKSAGIPAAMMQRMKPFFLEALIYPKLMNCKNMSGVEEELMKLSKINKQEIKGFETIAMQAAVFDSIPYAAQAESVLRAVDSMETYKKYFNSMVVAYRGQKLDEIEKMLNQKEFGVEENSELLLDKRNRNWVAQLDTILPGRNIFMAVGAAHLLGENGLIKLLQKKGYTVRPIVNQ